jgi:hypothetical protein
MLIETIGGPWSKASEQIVWHIEKDLDFKVGLRQRMADIICFGGKS